MAIIVSILSDQPIPVVLFIKQLASPQDVHLFLSTVEMEAKQKSATIAYALQIPNHQYKVLMIDANDPALILDVLDNYAWHEQQTYLVNLTGGTKMMSQMAYIHFSEKSNSTIYYWPIGTPTLQMLYPAIQPVTPQHRVALNLDTYFKAHGFEHQAQNELSYSYQIACQLLKACIAKGGAGFVPEIVKAKTNEYAGTDKGYLGGGWFEEWLYMTLKKALQLPDEAIGFNVKLKNKVSVRRSEADNEVDVAFVYKNRLFIWECKVYSMAIINPRKITEAVYKISSVSRALGLQATSIVCILAPFGHNMDRKAFINDISQAMRVAQVLGMEDLADQQKFITNIKKMVGYGT